MCERRVSLSGFTFYQVVDTHKIIMIVIGYLIFSMVGWVLSKHPLSRPIASTVAPLSQGYIAMMIILVMFFGCFDDTKSWVGEFAWGPDVLAYIWLRFIK